MSQGQIVQGVDLVVDMQTDLILKLCNAKCSDIASRLLQAKSIELQKRVPNLLFTIPDGTVTGDLETIGLKVLDYYEWFVKDGRAFKDIYDTIIEMTKYIDKITVEEI